MSKHTRIRRQIWLAPLLASSAFIAATWLAPIAVAQTPLEPIGAAKELHVQPVHGQVLPEQEDKKPVIKDVEQGPAPRAFDGFPPGATRLPRLASPFRTPQPSKKDIEEAQKYVGDIVDPKLTLDLVQGRGRLLLLKEVPKRIQIVDEKIAQFNVLALKDVTIIGRAVGTTILNIWFVDAMAPNKERVLSYLVRVFPDPEAKERVELAYQALQHEINQAFPDSVTHLRMVGDKVVLSGQAHDILEATQILRLVRGNTPADATGIIPAESQQATPDGVPGLENFKYMTAEQFRRAGGPNIINLMRIPGEQQVMLRVTVAEANRTAARSIGLNFNLVNNSGVDVVANRTGNIATGGTFTNFGGLGSLAGGLAGGAGGALAGLATNNIPVALDNGQIRLAINALRNLNYARSWAEPNLVALNGQTASFQAGGQFPVPNVTGYTASGLQGVTFVPFGVQLTFTPYITDKDRVRLSLQGSVSTRDNSNATTIAGANVPSLSSREFATTVELREGQTLAIAGLIQQNLGMDATRIPGIGDLPVLNWLTGFQRTSAAEQELIVLITPELVHPLEAKDVPPLPGSDLFEPSDLEFFVCGRLESRRHYDFRSPVMTDCARMRRYHRCEQIYIFGPSGHTPLEAVSEVNP